MKRGLIILGLLMWLCMSFGQCKAQDSTIRDNRINSTWYVNSTGSLQVIDTTQFSFGNLSTMFMFYDSTVNYTKIAGQYYIAQKKWVIKDTMQLIKIMSETITNDNIIAARFRDLISELYKVNKLQLQYFKDIADHKTVTLDRIDKQWHKIHTLERNLYNIKP